MKHWLWLLLLWPLIALASDRTSNPIKPSVIERMVFQNGVHPTPAYQGLMFGEIMQGDTTNCFGNGIGWSPGFISPYTWSKGDSISYLGCRDKVAPVDSLTRIIWKADISALPDSAVIKRAVLVFRILGWGAGIPANSPSFAVEVRRILRDIDSDSVSWNRRTFAGALAESAWAAAGCQDTSLTVTVLGASIAVKARYQPNTSSDQPLLGLVTYPLADTLYDGYTASDFADVLPKPDQTFSMARGSATGGTAWMMVDVTTLVDKWQTNTWKNCGARMNLNRDGVQTLYVRFITGGVWNKPALVVDYVNATTGVSTRSKTYLGAPKH